ncbi:MAG: hypothetical protein A2X82_08845 [Geobacteraceae bacterium GWC2_55_20]|nr:MAG: hypothetical protein A2X82_08845 [Geobacteraceae bacterium GWC2_55_20]OGU24961.1 MAG: hypothetical protein A2X85_14680 [Geobacteraceae bacterium GWF2_54_21]HCE69322.1 hypothetical protein [Geobacter sp.]
MKIKLSVSAFCCIFAVLVSSYSLAQKIDEAEEQNGDVLSIAKRPQKSLWETSVETTWLPGSAIRGAGSDLSMVEVKAGFTKRFRINPKVELSTGVNYSLREIDAPETARLPGSLQTLSLNLGGEYHSSDSLTLGFRASPGVSSDFVSLNTNDIRLPVAFHATYQMSPKLSFIGGVAYTGQNHSIPVLPVIGVLYFPAEQWALALGFPRTGVIYKPDRKTEVFVAGEFSRGEYRLHDTSVGADIISYRDYRVLTGAEIQLFPFIRLGISGGYAFAREFVFYEGNRSKMYLDGAPFGRLVVKLFW